MPIPADAKASNALFHPFYVPVAVFIGGTSGVGQGMVEAFARYVKGRAHIIIVGRNEYAASEIIGHFPKPAAGETSDWTHEFVPCDVSLMANVRAACALIRTKVERVNFLVLTAGYSSLVSTALTSEGLDLLLAMRYYYRFVFIQELLPLVQAAQALGQDAKVMSVLGAGLGSPKRPIDLDNLGNTVKERSGRIRVAIRSMMQAWGYTDAMMAHFATRNPAIAFTHIHPGAVHTPGLRIDLDGLLTPLSWLINLILPWLSVSQDQAAEHMLYALFTGERGLFIRDRYGDVISSLEFEAPVDLRDSNETSVLNGVPMTGYGASDLGVRRIMEQTEAVTRAQ
ncbi:hypothetical protein DFH07DRAFT_921238 [Mycena maculata]|uniref:NAD(P)-binding protein n=1 Tax=Mycena maculata TaxID=230809 RepID=A0AAD7NAS1_9AGAR|nr:hypothetical protein DFH07DRAFT_921238 [Mycena maculata]